MKIQKKEKKEKNKEGPFPQSLISFLKEVRK